MQAYEPSKGIQNYFKKLKKNVLSKIKGIFINVKLKS